MAQVVRLSLVIRAFHNISPSLSKIQSCIKTGQVHTARRVFSPQYNGVLKSLSKFKVRMPYPQNFSFPGRSLILGGICGISATLALVNVHSQVAYSMDGFDVLADNPKTLSSSASDSLDELNQILTLTRKIWLPFDLIVTVFVNWGYPIVLAFKAVLLLLSTKPRPSSVYLFVEKLYNHCSSHGPYLRYVTLYLTEVNVKDYKLICLGRVQIRDQRFILIGILGGWWILPSLDLSSFHDVFFVLRSCQQSLAESVRVEVTICYKRENI